MINKSKTAIVVTALFTCIASQASILSRLRFEDLSPAVEPEYSIEITAPPGLNANPFQETNRDDILPDRELLASNGINFRDLSAYFDYCRRKNLKSILIVGEVRGFRISNLQYDDDRKICHAVKYTDLYSYGEKAYDYFLIDLGWEEGHYSLDIKFGFSPSPDMFMNVMNLSRQTLGLTPDQKGFDRVIFENLPPGLAFFQAFP
jgi:hypothetical protein